jgi:hypothetical protein
MPEGNRSATKQEVHELAERLVEHLREVQAEILRAFHNSTAEIERGMRS